MNLSRGYLLLLAAILFVLSAGMVLPFAQYVMMAVLLAFVLYPLERRLTPRFGETISSFLLIVGALIAIVIPFAIMIGAVAGDALRLAQSVQQGEIGFAVVEEMIQDVTGREVDLASMISGSAENAAQLLAGGAPGVFEAVTHGLVGIGLMVFLLFFLLKDGDKLVAWIRTITPLPGNVQDELYGNVSAITSAVLLGHVLVAVLQGGIAGIGLFVTGIPNAVFWTFMMMILALLPAIGAFLVWGPAAAYLFYTGDAVAAVGLFVYGVIVVSLTDEFVRPLIVDRKAKINPSIIIVGVIGGMYLLGVMGLFFGPIILGALKVTLEVLDEHYHELGSA